MTSLPVHETHFTVKCPVCDQRYLVPRGTGQHRVGVRAFLKRGPRCTQPNNDFGGVCGTPLAESQIYTVRNGREPVIVPNPQSLLDWVVVRDLVYTNLATEAARAKRVDHHVAELESELAKLKATDLAAEVARLREKYETPCKGLVKRYGVDNALGYKTVPCGGFLGHPGDCAEVW